MNTYKEQIAIAKNYGRLECGCGIAFNKKRYPTPLLQEAYASGYIEKQEEIYQYFKEEESCKKFALNQN